MSRNEWLRKLADNTDIDHCTVKARLGKAGETSVKWGKWQTTDLHVQKNHKGEVTLITPRHPAWAEYDPRTYDLTIMGNGNALLIAEDYYMEISAGTKFTANPMPTAASANQ